MVLLRSSSALILLEGSLLTLLSSFSPDTVQILLALSALPTSLDNVFLSSYGVTGLSFTDVGHFLNMKA